MSNSAEMICEALDNLLSLRDQVRDTAETSRKLAAFYLDAEKVTKWIDELGRPFLEKSTSVGRSIDRSNKLLEEFGWIPIYTWASSLKSYRVSLESDCGFDERNSRIKTVNIN